jgi:phosphoserine phosphatase
MTPERKRELRSDATLLGQHEMLELIHALDAAEAHVTELSSDWMRIKDRLTAAEAREREAVAKVAKLDADIVDSWRQFSGGLAEHRRIAREEARADAFSEVVTWLRGALLADGQSNYREILADRIAELAKEPR